MISDKQFIFIIGAPRSGTSWLQLMIGAHPNVSTSVELTLYNKYIGPWIDAWKEEYANIEDDRWTQGLPYLLTKEDLYDFLREFVVKVYGRVHAANPKTTHILDKHPGYSMYVEDINELLPNSKFIHLIRDGRDVVVSMVAARKSMGFGTATVVDSSAEWKRHVRAAQKAKKFHDRYLEVRYEDLKSIGLVTLKSVFDFCELPASNQYVEKIITLHQFERMKARRQTAAKEVKAKADHYRKGKVGSWQYELGPIQKYLFHKIAGDLLYELGYADHSWWMDKGYQRITISLISSLPYAFFKIRPRVYRATAELLGPELAKRIKAVISNTWLDV